MGARWTIPPAKGCQKGSKRERQWPGVLQKTSAYTESLLENQQHPKMGPSHISNECHTDNFNEHANISHLPREPQTSSTHILNK